MLVVKKFGGTSVADRDRVFNVAGKIIEDVNKGNQVVLVLSAQGGTTDDILANVAEYSKNPPRREVDMLLATGEQVSCALMAIALKELGKNSVSLNAFQVGIKTDRSYSKARIKYIDKDRIYAELERNDIVIVTGFQGVNRYDDFTTLGRGGSDTTAVALAAALNADICEIYTDVDGVYSADPRLVKNAKKLNEISYDEMLELASLGAKVLHNRSVELAKKYSVDLHVRSSLDDVEGTIVKEEAKVEKMLVSGVAADKDVACISVLGIKNSPGIAFKLFNLLSREKINVDIILQSTGRDGKKDITFTVALDDLNKTVELVEENQGGLDFDRIEIDDKVAKVSLVGAGIKSDTTVASRMFEAMFDEGINIKMISTSQIKISLLIDEKYMNSALEAIHDEFARDIN